nr:Imm21 family immunity protein [Herbidospora yilanensis]
MTSLGGPLILIPESACDLWAGAPMNFPDEEGDYGRACAVDDYIGLIDVGTAQALVLGDVPARTTFLPQHGLLLREVASDDEDKAIEAVPGLLSTVNWESWLNWRITEPLILFDSVYDYPHVLRSRQEQLRLDLPPGDYTAEAAYMEIPMAYLILIRFSPTTRLSLA